MTRVADVEFAALDFETTGLDARKERVIEVAVVRGRAGERPRMWSTLVDPGGPVGATQIHGISAAMVSGQPRYAQIWPQLEKELGGAVLVAHNSAFDIGFMEAECARAGTRWARGQVLDTLGMARRLFSLPSNALGNLCLHFGVPRGRAHRAGDDALATWQLAWILLRSVDPELNLSVEGALALCERRTVKEGVVLYDALAAAWKRGEAIVIEYHARDSATGTRRSITIQRMGRREVEAWCHLRNAARVFRLDRIRLVEG